MKIGYFYFLIFVIFNYKNYGIQYIKCIIYPGVNIKNETMPILNTHIVNKSDILVWTNLNSSYYQLIPLNGTDMVELFACGVAREMASFLHIKNIYCTPKKAISTGYQNVIIYFYQEPPKLKTSYYYEHIIYLYSPYGNVFAHFVHDCLAELIAFPKELIKKSKIMISFNIDIAIQYLNIFNIQEDQILSDNKYWYYTSNLYLYLSQEPHNGYNMYSFQKIVNELRKYFKVDQIIGKRYVFINRRPKDSRYILNLYEFYEETKIKIPSEKWEIEQINYSSLKNISKNMASIKLLVTPSGSHTIYMMFMNRNYTTGICLIQSEWIDLPNYISAVNFQICAIGFSHQWEHFDHSPQICNIYNGLYCVQALYYILLNKKWPSNIENYFTNAFNFQDIYEITKMNISTIRCFTFQNCTIGYLNWSFETRLSLRKKLQRLKKLKNKNIHNS